MPPRLVIPEGYRMVETDEVVKEQAVEFYLWGFIARLRAEQANDRRLFTTYRYEARKTTKLERAKYGRLHRWAVIPYQNKLEKLDP